MSAEVVYSMSVKFKDSALNEELPISQKQLTVAVGDDLISGRPLVTDVAAALELGEVTDPGLAYFRNFDSTNTITISSDAPQSDVIAEIPPLQIALIWLESGTAVYASSSGAGGAKMFYRIHDRA